MKGLRASKYFLRGYVLIFVALAHLTLLGGIWYSLDHYQLTVSQFLVHATEKTDIGFPRLAGILPSAPSFTGHSLDGRLRDHHPRILLPGLSDWTGQGVPGLIVKRNVLYKRLGINAPDPCSDNSVLGQVACWVETGDSQRAEVLLKSLKSFTLETAAAHGNYGNGWQLALAYDFLRLYPQFSIGDRALIEAKIEQAIRDTLVLLDSASPSLWHGRSTLAAIAWLCTVVLDPINNVRQQLLTRAQGHFLEVMNALASTEAWPEGYNYWIQNRAFLITLAGSAYVNGLEDSQYASHIRNLLSRTGYWHIYATRPDNRIEGFGDEGSRIDLKDETRRVIDIIAQLTHDPILASYSAYLDQLHGIQSYYRGYRWGFKLFNDPEVAPFLTNDLSVFNEVLPTAELFGRNALNLAYIRSGWLADDTFISFKAGHVFTHHGHYDAGHFSLFKGEPLAINSSVYGKFTGPNRLYYSIRSIAKNTLLILRPGEKVRPNKIFQVNVADGGQRIVLPTGSGIRSVRHWMDNLGKGLHLEGGVLNHFEHHDGEYTYLAADLTAAYNNPHHDEGGQGGKVDRVIRQLLYLPAEDRLIIYDQVSAIKPNYIKKWLLHTVNRPQVDGLRVLKGDAKNGILESRVDLAVVENGRGNLVLKRLFPKNAVLRLVGGRDYQYYIEADSDETYLNGQNFNQGAVDKPWFDVGLWRLEIQPSRPRKEDEFLVVLTPSLDQVRSDIGQALQVLADNAKGVVTGRSVTVFISRSEVKEARFILPVGRTILRVFGLSDQSEVELHVAGLSQRKSASANGVAVFNLSGELEETAILRLL